MTPALLRIWSVVAGAACGALLPPSAWSLGAAPLVLLGLVRRRAVAAVVALAAVGLLAVQLPRLVRGIPAPPERAMRCAVGGRVLESAGGLGTLLATQARCEGGAWAGVAVVDRALAPGAPFSGEAYLLPLGHEAFERARRAAGAQAQLHPLELEVARPAGAFAAAAAFRARLRAATGPGEAAGLLRGLAIGDTRGLTPATTGALRRAGLSHLVAVSGSNVAIVLVTVAVVLRRFPRGLRHAACLAALGFFVLVTGPEPSVLRAAVTAVAVLAGLTAGVRADPLHALGLALAVLLVTRPALAGAVGLHLSVAATAGIVLWAPSLAARLPGPRAVAAVVAVTLAAQLAVAPILIATFGEVSLVAPLANAAAAPVVPPATVLAFAAGLAQPLAPGLAGFLAGLAERLAGWILTVGRTLGTGAGVAEGLGDAWAFAAGAAVLVAAGVALARR